MVGLSVSAGASHARPPAGLAGEPTSWATAALEGSLSAGPAWTFLGTVSGGLAVEGEGSWGVAALTSRAGHRLGRRSALELVATASAFRVGPPFGYEAVELRVTPALLWRFRPGWELRVRGHGGAAHSVVEAGTARTTTDAALAGGGAEVGAPLGRARLRLALDALVAEAGTFGVGRVGLDAPLGGARVGAEVAVWSLPGGGGEEAALAASLEVPLGGRAALRASGGRTGPDPLLGTSPGAWAAGTLRWDLIRPPLARSGEPVVEVVDAESGVVRFSLEADADSVAVLGDFNGWEPVALARTGDDGRWEVRMEVPPGLHHFGFLVDGEWHVPEGAPGRMTDEWGRPTATLVVSGGAA